MPLWYLYSFSIHYCEPKTHSKGNSNDISAEQNTFPFSLKKIINGLKKEKKNAIFIFFLLPCTCPLVKFLFLFFHACKNLLTNSYTHFRVNNIHSFSYDSRISSTILSSLKIAKLLMRCSLLTRKCLFSYEPTSRLFCRVSFQVRDHWKSIKTLILTSLKLQGFKSLFSDLFITCTWRERFIFSYLYQLDR